MKKIISGICLMALMLSCAVFFNGCGKNDDPTVMNVSLNPQVEFILDENNKVLSVNALNEEGNLIINGQVFVGKTADEALELFVSVSKETGYLVTGNVSDGDNEIEISLSGDTKEAEKLYNNLKNNLNDYLNENDITATLTNAGALTQEYLKEQVKKCMPYLDNEELNDMDYEDMVDALTASRQETAEMLSQQIKDAYYQSKAYAVEMAKFEHVKSQLSSLNQTLLNTALIAYNSAIESIENTRMTYLVNENSDYQQALASLRQAKVDYLKYRNYVASLEQNEITQTITNQLDAYETALNNAQTALDQMYTIANNYLNTATTQVTNAYNVIITTIQNFSVDLEEMLDDAETNINTAITDFETQFNTDYQTLITNSKTKLDNMKDQLTE